MSYNKRFPEMWKILTRHIDFEGKTLLDVGCGYGDLIIAAYEQGATVYGMDRSDSVISYLLGNNSNRIKTGKFTVIQHDINLFLSVTNEEDDKFDILTCFSVLPYLQSPKQILRNFSEVAKVVIIECQYYGDGPGLSWIRDDTDMSMLLQDIWPNVRKIGQTFIENRNRYRGIWICNE